MLFIKDRGWGILALLGSVALAVEGLLPYGVSISTPQQKKYLFIAVLVSAVAAVLGGVLELAKTPRLSKLVAENGRMRGLLQELVADHRSQVDMILGSFFGEVFPGDHTTRVSAYRHDGQGRFVLAGRYSLSQVFRRSHRTEFPENQGVLGEVWANGDVVVMEMPDPSNLKKYASFHFNRWGIPKEVVKAFTMKPRSYVAVPLCTGNPTTYIGVVVLESTDPSGVNPRHVEHLKASSMMMELVDFLQAGARIEPYVSFAAERQL